MLTWQELRLAAEAGFEELLQEQEAQQASSPARKTKAAAYISPLVAKKNGEAWEERGRGGEAG